MSTMTNIEIEALTHLQLDKITVGDRCRKDLGDLNGLAASIRTIGLLHPLVLSPELELISGRRRLEALRILGKRNAPCVIIDIKNLLVAERDENTQRKDFTPTEAVAIGAAIEELEKERAKRKE